ncbi:GNAT family N-acetyltransferase [Aerococcus sp. 1KP-2016]|uniref:GNAT family N-acetyltransferase n=1 Tax=Aerococcus sp. 1KP-2016 TaxID=1981982 RepID=UPI000B999545|nr:GNAT family N-acetyltransferase [Aerococcus sp. 1KP-2016]OYQ66739.1 GNAT family N-acetyltransferase [Aerococcus sp. 1KP-2016]
MQLISKYFDQLNTSELYEILRVRSEIFVVEQNCVYQDIDGKDQESIHIYIEEHGRILAYLRAFKRADDVVQMGRVLTRNHGLGLGGKILHDGIAVIKQEMNPSQIYIEAQTYAIGFYEREGFVVSSEELLEDEIPHVKMLLDI